MNTAMFEGECEICDTRLDRTFEADDFVTFIEIHLGHGVNGQIATLQSYKVMTDDG